MTTLSVLAVIPSLSVNRLHQIGSLVREFDLLGMDTVVVANGRRLDQALEGSGIAKISVEKNLGFGAAVNVAVDSHVDWKWLLIVNDDIELDVEKFRASVSRYLCEVDGPTVVYFDETPPKRIPRSLDVFRSLALLDGMSKALHHTRAERTFESQDERAYRSFSMVAVSREAWAINHGFDERFAFTYEDSDFVRRGVAAGIRFTAAESSGSQHIHSATGRDHIESVLPVSAWSGYQYLVKWGRSEASARLICMAALIARIPLIPFVHGSRRRHFLGDARALSAMIRNREPALPDYWLA